MTCPRRLPDLLFWQTVAKGLVLAVSRPSFCSVSSDLNDGFRAKQTFQILDFKNCSLKDGFALESRRLGDRLPEVG